MDKGHGEQLIEQLVQLTGIPSQIIRKELNVILEKRNYDFGKLTVEQLRVVVAAYLREIMGGMLDSNEPPPADNKTH